MDAQKIEGLFVAFVGGAWLLIALGKLPTPALLKHGWAKKFQYWVGPLMIAFGVFLMFEPRPKPKLDLEALATGIKREITLPMELGPDITLADIRPIDGSLGYFFTLTDASVADEDLAKRWQSQIVGLTCKSPQYARLSDNGVSIRVIAKTKLGDTLASTLITPVECKK